MGSVRAALWTKRGIMVLRLTHKAGTAYRWAQSGSEFRRRTPRRRIRVVRRKRAKVRGKRIERLLRRAGRHGDLHERRCLGLDTEDFRSYELPMEPGMGDLRSSARLGAVFRRAGPRPTETTCGRPAGVVQDIPSPSMLHVTSCQPTRRSRLRRCRTLSFPGRIGPRPERAMLAVAFSHNFGRIRSRML